MKNAERDLVRDLALRYLEGIERGGRARKIEQWRAVNSLRPAAPPVYARAFAWRENPASECVCAEPVARTLEGFFRYHIYWQSLEDDAVFQPWHHAEGVHKTQGWGLSAKRVFAREINGLEACKIEAPIQDYEADFPKLRRPRLDIDHAATDAREEALNELVGDLMPIEVSRGGWARGWAGDIAMTLGNLRGIENIMLDVYERPEDLKRLAAFIRDGVLAQLDETERAGEMTLLWHSNQAMPYADGLTDPAPNARGVAPSSLWHFQAAQEFALIGPAQHREFLLECQHALFRRHALVAYGCCEDLTNKIDMLREIPNLRRIAVSPFADVAKCAEQIGGDYTISYRPNPALLAAGYDKARLSKRLREDFAALRANGCVFDVTLKDVETLEGKPGRARDFIAAVREAAAD